MPIVDFKHAPREERAKHFEERASCLHHNKYKYRLETYVDDATSMAMICPTHGEFWQTPNNHLQGKGCPHCNHKSVAYTLEEALTKLHNIFGDRYDFSLVAKYCKREDKAEVICPIHGKFTISFARLFGGHGCQKCAIEKQRLNSRTPYNQMVADARAVHGDKYEYDESTYVKMSSQMRMICPLHGEFRQTPHKHINLKHGCPKCNASHLEEEVRNLLIENEIEFEEQKRAPWLGLQVLDFYLPKQKIAIECQGMQHFKENSYFCDSLSTLQERDERKRKACKEQGVKMLYYSDKKWDYPYKVYTDKNEIIQAIKEHDGILELI